MALKYKVGDKIRIKSIDWYNENKDNYGAIYAGNGFCFWKNMARHCGKIMKITIVKVDPEDLNKGYYFMENCEERWTDEMIEGLAEEEMSLDKAGQITDFEYDGLAYTLPEGYIFKDENGNEILTSKIILEKKKKEYPKTYEECCKVLSIPLYYNLRYHTYERGYGEFATSNELLSLQDKLNLLGKLIICRDVYWKIAGEEMGLDKPWKPDWKNDEQFKYIITCRRGCIIKDTYTAKDVILAFPTEEMRDAFYENFKELIEQCKELL